VYKFSPNTIITTHSQSNHIHYILILKTSLQKLNNQPLKMKFTTATALTSTLALAAAAPTASNSTTPLATDKFRLMAIRSGSEIHYANIQAVKGGLRLNYPKQPANCPDPDVNWATFSLSQDTGALSLFEGNPGHTAYVDRSGMGQGVIGFTTGVQPLQKNAERGPFEVKEDGEFVFAPENSGEVGFQACPLGEGEGWSIWLAGVEKPAQQEGCLGFKARAMKEDNPQKCGYNGMDGSA
jgi:hypothetical protein